MSEEIIETPPAETVATEIPITTTPIESKVEPTKEPTAEEKRKAELAENMRMADEANKKIQARVAELKTYEGKTFQRKDGSSPNQTIKIIRYEGIGEIAVPNTRHRETLPVHLFRVESKNPGAIWTPPATQFLEEHQEIQVPKPVKQEVI